MGAGITFGAGQAKGDFLELKTAKWNLAEGRVAILRFGKSVAG